MSRVLVACEYSGRLPQRVQDAIAVVTADVAATATPQDQAIYDGMAARYQRDRTAGLQASQKFYQHPVHGRINAEVYACLNDVERANCTPLPAGVALGDGAERQEGRNV